ncbi:MAG: hypothetical protein ONB46_19450 [candidate division KSB1 bacterium]|nr:hypothetical protein [candidate division KSB1 bacterium]MDZ7368053.1 hypothetical protein [candidate division KSB1 bacterium]MDZ7405721.1 hypothetical protein [candidate division KSB1 bacterium]
MRIRAQVICRPAPDMSDDFILGLVFAQPLTDETLEQNDRRKDSFVKRLLTFRHQLIDVNGRQQFTEKSDCPIDIDNSPKVGAGAIFGKLVVFTRSGRLHGHFVLAIVDEKSHGNQKNEHWYCTKFVFMIYLLSTSL